MNAKLTLTPVSNVDYSNMRVIDESKIFTKTYSWYDEVEVYDAKKNIIDLTHVSSISLYDDRLYIDEVQHHILHMFSYSN